MRHTIFSGLVTLVSLCSPLALLQASELGGDFALKDGKDAVKCDSCCSSWMDSVGIQLYAGYDSFKQGPNDLYGSDNSGGRFSANVGVPLLADYDIGAQVGGSLGIYDWNGRGQGDAHNEEMLQGFVTFGLFKSTDPCEACSWTDQVSWAIAYDTMWANNWTTLGEADIRLSQWRGEIAYSLNGCNKIGLLGVLDDQDDDAFASQAGPNAIFRPISHLDIFWQYTFETGARTRLWFGLPERQALGESGSRIDYLVGGSFSVPVSCRMKLYGAFQYGNPSASTGDASYNNGGDRDYYSSVSVGIVIYPGKKSCCTRRWQPYLPVADNMSFLVDGLFVDEI